MVEPHLKDGLLHVVALRTFVWLQPQKPDLEHETNEATGDASCFGVLSRKQDYTV